MFHGATKANHVKFVTKTIMAYAAITELANRALTGHGALDNRRGNELSIETPIKDEKGRPLAVAPNSWAKEYLNILNRPLKTLVNKAGPVAKEIYYLMGGETYGKTKLKAMVDEATPVPISIMPLIQRLYRDLTKPKKKKAGVPATFLDAMAQFALDFAGFSGAYRSGYDVKGSAYDKATMLDVFKADSIIDKLRTGKAAIMDEPRPTKKKAKKRGRKKKSLGTKWYKNF